MLRQSDRSGDRSGLSRSTYYAAMPRDRTEGRARVPTQSFTPLRHSASLPVLSHSLSLPLLPLSDSLSPTNPKPKARLATVYNDTRTPCASSFVADDISRAPYASSFVGMEDAASPSRAGKAGVIAFQSSLNKCELEFREILHTTPAWPPCRARAEACLAALHTMSSAAHDTCFAGLLPCLEAEVRRCLMQPGGTYHFEASRVWENDLASAQVLA